MLGVSAQQVDWIEIVKISAPYLASAFTLIGVFAAAGLSQRNWVKQFGKQQEVLLFEKRLQLADQVLESGIAASTHATRAAMHFFMTVAFKSLQSEGHQVPQKVIDQHASNCVEENNAYSESINELTLRSCMIKAVFNENLAGEASRCLVDLSRFAEKQTVRAPIIADIKNAFVPGTETATFLSTATQIVNDYLGPIDTETGHKMAGLFNDMIEYARQTGVSNKTMQRTSYSCR